MNLFSSFNCGCSDFFINSRLKEDNNQQSSHYWTPERVPHTFKEEALSEQPTIELEKPTEVGLSLILLT